MKITWWMKLLVKIPVYECSDCLQWETHTATHTQFGSRTVVLPTEIVLQPNRQTRHPFWVSSEAGRKNASLSLLDPILPCVPLPRRVHAMTRGGVRPRDDSWRRKAAGGGARPRGEGRRSVRRRAAEATPGGAGAGAGVGAAGDGAGSCVAGGTGPSAAVSAHGVP